jgi:hypothetical protein
MSSRFRCNQSRVARSHQLLPNVWSRLQGRRALTKTRASPDGRFTISCDAQITESRHRWVEAAWESLCMEGRNNANTSSFTLGPACAKCVCNCGKGVKARMYLEGAVGQGQRVLQVREPLVRLELVHDAYTAAEARREDRR